MKPGEISLSNIDCFNDIVLEAESYLSFLEEKFVDAIPEVKMQNFDFEIIKDLSVGNIFTNEDFVKADRFSVTDEDVRELVFRLRSRLDIIYPLPHFIQASSNAIGMAPEHVIRFEDGNLVQYFDPSIRLLSYLIRSYMIRINLLVDTLIKNNEALHFDLLISTRYPGQFGKWLEEKCTNLQTEEEKFIHVSKVITLFREEILSSTVLPTDDDWIEVCNLMDCCVVKHESESGFVHGFAPVTTMHANEHFRLIKVTLLKHLSKITIWSPSKTFIDLTIQCSSSEPLLVKEFIENYFHFVSNKWRPIQESCTMPEIKACDFVQIIKMHMDEGLLTGYTKEYVIHFLQYLFFGIRGYRYSNLKTYFSRRKNKPTRKQQLEFKQMLIDCSLVQDVRLLHFQN